MQRIIALLLTGLFVSSICQAQFTASGGVNGSPYVYAPSASTGLDKVFIFDGITKDAQLIYTTSTPPDWSWYQYGQDPSTAVLVSDSDVHTTTTQTILKNIKAGGYILVSGEGSKHYVYVVAYTPVNYNEIQFVSDGDQCNTVTLAVSATENDLVYFTTSGIKKVLDRQHTLTWKTLDWNSADKKYVPVEMSSTSANIAYNWSVTAPLTDTYFTVSGDQYANYFGNTVNFKSALYTAVAVKTNSEAFIQERTATNELDKVSSSADLSGSAPLNIQFYSHPSNAVQFYEWYIYDSADGSGSFTRYTDENILHSFRESGTSLVKIHVSNSTCKDSASFSPNVSVSSLDCPNFFTPRSSPGENDEFKVAYKSIVSFKGTIVNRWGNVLFEWTDPSQGWNGTYRGKAVSPGVYFYLIEAKGSDGIVYKKKGDINLLE
jgi:gliding motility-associated-like protein